MEHFNIRISGKVQGVFFRASTQKRARELGITGWVKNEQDGTVYLEAEGETEQLEALTKWCNTGPERAEVEDVKVEREDKLKGFNGFEVKRN